MDKERYIPVVTYGKINWTANVEAPSNDRALLLNSRPGASKHNPTMKDSKFHATTDAGLWYLVCNSGDIPEPLKQRFTKYSMLLKAVREYYDKKEVDVKEVA